MSTPSRPHSLRRNALANVGGRSISALLWLVMTPFVLTHLGPERFAVWSLFFALGGYVANFDLGMTHGVSRYVAVGATRGDRSLVADVLRRSLTVGTALGVAWCLVFVVLREPFLHGFKMDAFAAEARVGLVVFALSVLAFSVTQVLHGALVGFQRLDLSNAFMLSGLFAHLGLLWLGLARGGGLIAAAGAMTAGHVVSGLMASVAVRRQLRAVSNTTTGVRVSWRELVRFGGLVQATGVLATGWQHAGKIVLGMMGPLVWVTTFELGYRVALAILSLPQLIVGAVIPAAARASTSGDDADVRQVYEWASRWIFALAGPLLAGLWLLAPSLIMLWLGPGHADSAAVTRAGSLMFAVLILAGPATGVARGAGSPGVETLTFAIAFVLDVGLSLVLVPRLGPLGAVWAMGLSIAVAAVFIVVRVHARLHVRTGAWLRDIAIRIGGPGLAAAGVAVAGLSPEPSGRAEALRHLLVAAPIFAALVVLVTWPSGDALALLRQLRARWAAPPLAGASPGGRA